MDYVNIGLQAAKLHLGLVVAPWISDAVGLGAHDELMVGVVRVVEEHTVVELDHACPKWHCFSGIVGQEEEQKNKNMKKQNKKNKKNKSDSKNEDQGLTTAKRVVVVHADLDLERGVAEEESGSSPPPPHVGPISDSP